MRAENIAHWSLREMSAGVSFFQSLSLLSLGKLSGAAVSRINQHSETSLFVACFVDNKMTVKIQKDNPA
jgi:hypothetical protein